MDRRALLVAAAVALTGCVSGTDDGNEDDGGEGETDVIEDSSDVVELLGHEFVRPVGSGFDIRLTVENVSDGELGSVTVEVAVFQDSRRLDQTTIRYFDLPAGVSEQEDGALPDVTRPDDVTHYTLSIEARTGERRLDAFEQEYSGDEFRSRVE